MPKAKKSAKKKSAKGAVRRSDLSALVKKITVSALKSLPTPKLEKVSSKLQKDAVEADKLLDRRGWGDSTAFGPGAKK